MADDDFSTMWRAIDDIRTDARRVDTRTSVHEAVCAERYQMLNHKLNYILTGLALLAIGEALGLGRAVGALLHVLGLPS